MLKLIGTDLVISKGYGDQPALRFSEDGKTKSVRFQIGKRVYDTRVEGNQRWINLNVKAFGDLCERIKNMKLKEGSYIHLEGRYDEDVWEEDGTTKRVPVVILTDIEYAYTGNGNKQNGSQKDAEVEPNAEAQSQAQDPQKEDGSQTEMEDGFTGFSGFGSPNPFYPSQE